MKREYKSANKKENSLLKFVKCCKIRMPNKIRIKNKITFKTSILIITLAICFTAVCFFAVQSGKSVSGYPQQIVVAIDAGHGGIDNGASGNGEIEAVLNLQIAKKLQTALCGVDVATVMTREDENGLYGTTLPGFKKRDMRARKEICESSGASLVVSIHMNASQIKDRSGVVIYCNTQNSESVALANAIASQLANASVKNGDFYMTTKLSMPSVLVECGFITTASESYKLASEEYQTEIANLIARGILIYNLGVAT